MVVVAIVAVGAAVAMSSGNSLPTRSMAYSREIYKELRRVRTQAVSTARYYCVDVTSDLVQSRYIANTTSMSAPCPSCNPSTCALSNFIYERNYPAPVGVSVWDVRTDSAYPTSISGGTNHIAFDSTGASDATRYVYVATTADSVAQARGKDCFQITAATGRMSPAQGEWQ